MVRIRIHSQRRPSSSEHTPSEQDGDQVYTDLAHRVLDRYAEENWPSIEEMEEEDERWLRSKGL